MWEEMLSSRSSVIILSKCYHLVLSCDVIIWDDNTPLFLFFLKTSLTQKNRLGESEGGEEES